MKLLRIFSLMLLIFLSIKCSNSDSIVQPTDDSVVFNDFYPKHAKVKDLITITGSGFANFGEYAYWEIPLDGSRTIRVTLFNNGNDKLIGEIPDNAFFRNGENIDSAFIKISYMNVAKEKSYSYKFSKPIIIYKDFSQIPVLLYSVKPNSGLPCDTVVISGEGFTSDSSLLKVFVDEKEAQILEYTNTKCKIIIPHEFDKSDSVRIKISKGLKSVQSQFYFYLNNIENNFSCNWFKPKYSIAGDTVEFHGWGYGSEIRNIDLLIGNAKSKIVYLDNILIKALVPNNIFGWSEVKVVKSQTENCFKEPIYIMHHQYRFNRATVEITDLKYERKCESKSEDYLTNKKTEKSWTDTIIINDMFEVKNCSDNQSDACTEQEHLSLDDTLRLCCSLSSEKLNLFVLFNPDKSVKTVKFKYFSNPRTDYSYTIQFYELDFEKFDFQYDFKGNILIRLKLSDILHFENIIKYLEDISVYSYFQFGGLSFYSNTKRSCEKNLNTDNTGEILITLFPIK